MKSSSALFPARNPGGVTTWSRLTIPTAMSCSFRFQTERTRNAVLMTKRRNVIVHIATSADGYIARPDGDLEWLTSRPAPPGFYGMNAFMKTIDATVLGRKTYEESLRLGAPFGAGTTTYVFSRQAPPATEPLGVEFVNGDVATFVR